MPRTDQAGQEILNMPVRDSEGLGTAVDMKQVLQIEKALQNEGALDIVLEAYRGDIVELRKLQGTLFDMAMEAGIERDVISTKIEEINYGIYRESMIDIGFDFFNRKALDAYDPDLACQVLTAQIKGFADMLKNKV